MRPVPGLRVTLISRARTSIYSGMMPGHIAGRYGLDEISVNLDRLSVLGGHRLLVGEIEGLDDCLPRPRSSPGADSASVNVGSPTSAPFPAQGTRHPGQAADFFIPSPPRRSRPAGSASSAAGLAGSSWRWRCLRGLRGCRSTWCSPGAPAAPLPGFGLALGRAASDSARRSPAPWPTRAASHGRRRADPRALHRG